MKDNTIIGILVGIAVGWLLFHHKGGSYAGVTNVPTSAEPGTGSAASDGINALPFLTCPCGGSQ